MTPTPPEAAARRLLRSPFDFAGGLFLIGLAALGLVGGFDLPTGTLSSIGSGLVPRVVAVMVGAFGVLLIVQSLIFEGESRLERWHARGPVFVLGAVVLFAMVVRGTTLTFGGFAGIPDVEIPPLGLVVAGPLAVVVSSLASRETRPVEIAVFSVVMTLACGLLFKEFLGLPIPFDPAGLIPGPINSAYQAATSAIAYVLGIVKNLLVG